MNSCLYKATVMHNRLWPKQHRFHYNVFMFYVDLDELPMLSKKLRLFSIDRFNFFSFRKNEHLQLPAGNPDQTRTTRQQIETYLRENNIYDQPAKIMLLTNMNVLGYNFNPVSFYFCFDASNQPLACIAEVSNTYREMKPYLLDKTSLTKQTFSMEAIKYFYVSPFTDHDTSFHFNLTVPSGKLNLKIDNYKEDERIFLSTLTGTKKPLTNLQLLRYAVGFPFLTLRIMFLIHWQAMLLWRKQLRYHPKAANGQLQRGVYKRYKG